MKDIIETVSYHTPKIIDVDNKKSLEEAQEATDSISEQRKKEGTNVSWGSLQLEAEGSPTPVVENSTTFEQTVTSHPTISPRFLHFSITDGLKSRKTGLEYVSFFLGFFK